MIIPYFCLVSEPDIFFFYRRQTNEYEYEYIAATAPAVTGSDLMRRFSLFLAQCDLTQRGILSCRSKYLDSYKHTVYNSKAYYYTVHIYVNK